MQGRARGRKGERKTHHITSYHHITMEFGGYLLNVAKNPTRARARKGEAQGVLSYQKVTGIFDNPHIYSNNSFISVRAVMQQHVNLCIHQSGWKQIQCQKSAAWQSGSVQPVVSS